MNGVQFDRLIQALQDIAEALRHKDIQIGLALDQEMPAPKKAPRVPDPLLGSVLEVYSRVTGSAYIPRKEDFIAFAELKKHVAPEQIASAWEFSLRLPAKDWCVAGTIAQLKSKWNDIAARRVAPPERTRLNPHGALGD